MTEYKTTRLDLTARNELFVEKFTAFFETLSEKEKDNVEFGIYTTLTVRPETVGNTITITAANSDSDLSRTLLKD